MAKSRSASVKQERSPSPLPQAVKVEIKGEEGEDDDVARLFDDDGVKPEADEPEHVEVQGGANGEDDGEDDAKGEGEDSVTMVADASSSRSSSADVKSSESASASPHPGGADRPSTTPPTGSKHKTKKAKAEVQLIGDLPRAEEEAMKVFVEIEGCHYQYGTLGRSREALESMTCDCQYDHGQSSSFSFLGPLCILVRVLYGECDSDGRYPFPSWLW